MGKSRSATVAIAYLLHRQPDTLTPQAALAILRETRPLCEPNSGFMEQLNIYHKMGCPDDVTGQPLYSRWIYNREVEESVACGRAPEISSVLFEDEQPHRQEEDDRSTEIKCRKCRYVFLCFLFPACFSFWYVKWDGYSKKSRRTLANTPFIIPHEEERRTQLHSKNHSPIGTECAHVFLHPLTWMRQSLFPNTTHGSNGSSASVYGAHPDDAPLSGRLTCPNATCAQNIGKFAWQGMQCSCGSWVVPAIGIAKARIDVVKRSPLAARSPAAALGIRLPPGMRPDAEGRGNNL